MTNLVPIPLPLLVSAVFIAYFLVIRRLHLRRRTVAPDPETCSSGGSYWWRGSYRFPPSLGPVEEECERCGAIRVIAYENGIEEGTILSYEHPTS